MTEPLSVLMLDGEETLSLFVARCLGQVSNLCLHVLSERRWAPLRFSRYCRSFQILPPACGDEERFHIIAEAVKQRGIDVILPVMEPAMKFAQRYHGELAALAAPLPTPTLEVLDIMTDKWSLAQFMSHQGLPAPPTQLVSTPYALQQQLGQLDFPVLVKPRQSWNGEGIRLFEDAQSLQQYVSEQAHELPPAVMQRFIHGYDIDCSVVCRDGEILAYTIQKGFLRRTGDYFSPPSGIEFIQQEAVLNLAQELMSRLQWNGVAHMDMRFDEVAGDVKLLEINARFWSSIMGSLLMGVNFPHLACLTALQIPFPRPGYRCGRFVDFNVYATHLRRQLWARQRSDYRLSETSSRYVVGDPLAEVVRQLGSRA